MRLHPGLYGVAILAMLTVASIAPGAEPPVGPALTPKLLASLREEMQLVLGASQDILAALVTGDHATVADRAQKITRSLHPGAGPDEAGPRGSRSRGAAGLS